MGQVVIGDDIWLVSRALRWIEDSRGRTIAVLKVRQWRIKVAWSGLDWFTTTILEGRCWN